MKKIIAVCLTAVLLFAGCSKAPEQADMETKQEIVYSNLADEASQKEVAALLTEHGISKEQAEVFMDWVTDFNGRVSEGKLAGGFQPMEETGVSYDTLNVDYKTIDEAKTMPEEEQAGTAEDLMVSEEIAPEANCRLTSYLLMQPWIQTNGKQLEHDTILMFDIEAIDTYAPFHMEEADRSNFISLFNWIPLEGADTLEAHIAKIQQAWKEREIQITGDGISLINVYLHNSFDDTRFVGHTGVLLESADGLLFVEKYGPAYPFQATKFQNREQLKTYLLARPDLYGDETELKPIVMENGMVI